MSDEEFDFTDDRATSREREDFLDRTDEDEEDDDEEDEDEWECLGGARLYGTARWGG